MKIHWEYFVAFAIGIIVLLLIWFLPPMMKMQVESNIWILRSGLFLLGGVGISGLLWWAANQRAETSAAASAAYSAQSTASSAGVSVDSDATQKVSQPMAGGSEDVESLAKEAQQHLTSSRLGRGATLGNLPAIFLLGESGSAKTSTVLASGLEPELLAGQAMQEGQVAATRAANFWLARKTVFVEAGGRLLHDPGRWTALVKRMMPGKLHSVFGRKQQAPRAAVVCLDCEMFTKPNAADAVGAASRNLRARLGEISQHLGISFPVYVIFTRADRLGFFPDYARPLTNEEASQVFGSTLTMSSGGAGVYAEQETKRLTAAINSLFNSLCEWRLPLLSREGEATRQPGIYEFPREFRKLRSLAVQFMVDLCRPSQLRTAPFLRGFYFTGTRTVQQQVMSAAPTTIAQSPFAAPKAETATSMMSMDDARKLMDQMQSQQAPAAGGGTREVTVPVFLGHLFSHVILQDQSAMGASGASTKVSGLQRVLYATAAIIALIFAIGFTVSFFGNKSLLNRVTTAAAAAAIPAGADPAQPPTLEQLQKLDALRTELEQLNTYAKDGAPWRLRWGLFIGNRIRPDVRRTYFDRFHQSIFGRTQDTLHKNLSALPFAPGPTDEYGPAYEQLKAYLITTSNPDKSTREFLAPVLMKYWPHVKAVDDAQRGLANAQFGFYADELKASNPFTSSNDAQTIERARSYLSKFAATQRIYRDMRAAAARKIPPFQFNKKYPDAGSAVVNSVEVEGAFQKDGWAFMQDAIKNPQRFIGGEEWVLGPQAAASIDFAKLQAELSTMYTADYIKQWRDVVAGTNVLGYSSIADASQKLLKHSGNQPPLMALFCEVSANTNVDSDAVKNAFQAMQQVQPAACRDAGTFVNPPNATYVQALQPLQGCLEQVNLAPPDQKEMVKAQCLQGTLQAKGATRQVTVTLKPDPEAKLDKTIERLMMEPIVSLQPIVEPGAVGTGALCEAFNRLKNKYPFSANPAAPQATLAEVAEFFQPGTGVLSTFYEQNLKQPLPLLGTQYTPAPGARFAPGFVQFFNQAAAIQRALYPNNSPTPRYGFTVRPTVEGAQGVSLTINGQTHASGIGAPVPMNFVWPGAGEQKVILALRNPDYVIGTYDGTWGVVQMLTDADKVQPIGNQHRAEWNPRSGRTQQPVRSASGQPVRIIFDVDTGGAPFIFRPGFFSGMTCGRR